MVCWAALAILLSSGRAAISQTTDPCAEVCTDALTPPQISIERLECGCDSCIQPGDKVCFKALWTDIDHVSGGGPGCLDGDHAFPPKNLEAQWHVSGPDGSGYDEDFHTNWDPLDAVQFHAGFAWIVPFGAATGDYTITISANDYFDPGPAPCLDQGGPFEASLVVHVNASCSRAGCISVTEPGPGQAAAQAQFTCEHTGPVTWMLTVNEAGATIDSEGIIRAPLDASGLIVIEAQADSQCAEPRPFLLHARSLTALSPTTQSCGSCSEGDCEAGTGAIHLGSIEGRIKLGRTKTGLVAPDLLIHGDRISEGMAHPNCITPPEWGGEIEVIKIGDPQVLRQIVTGNAIVDVVIVGVSQGSEYRLDFYRRDQAPSAPGGDGIYALTGAPYVTWTSHYDDSNGLSIVRAPTDGPTLTHTFLSPPTGQPPFPAECHDDRDIEMNVSGLGVNRTEKIWHFCTPSASILEIAENGQSYVLKRNEQTYPNNRIIRTEEEGASLNQLVAVRATITEYYGDDQPAGKPNQVRAIAHQNAGIVWYDYDEQGRLKEERRSFKDDPPMPAFTTPIDIPTPDAACCHRKLYFYGSASENHPGTIDEYLQGALVGRTFYEYSTPSPGVSKRVEWLVTNPINGGQLCSTFWCVTDHEELPIEVSTPDGRVDSYERATGAFGPLEGENPGTFTTGSGTFIRTSLKHQAVVNGDPTFVPFQSTMEVSISDAMRRVLQTETHVCTGGDSWERVAWTKFIRDARGRVTDTYKSDGAHTSEVRDCCHATSVTAADGTVTNYEYDALGRVTKETRVGAPATTFAEFPNLPIAAQDDRITTYTYVGNNWIGQMLTVGTDGEQAGAPTRKRTTEYDTVGRPLHEEDEVGRAAEYNYQVAPGGGWMITHTDFDRTARTTEYFLDGRVKSVTGDVIPDYYDYDLDQGQVRKLHWVGFQGSDRWDRVVYDFAGRESRRERPGFSASGNPPVLISTNTYDTRGLLTQVTNPETAPTVYEHDDFGTLIRSGLDVDYSGTLINQSNDRVNGQLTYYEHDSAGWWLRTDRFTYGDGPNFGVVSLGVERDKLLTAGAVHESIDPNDNKTISTTTFDPVAKKVLQTIHHPDSNVDELHLTYNGLDVAQQTKTGVRSTTEFDILGQVTATTDGRTGKSTISRAVLTSGVFPTIKTTFVGPAPANITSSITVAYSALGREETTTSPPDGQFAQGKKTIRTFNTLGQLASITGDSPYPTTLFYDAFGSLEILKTARGCGPIIGPDGNNGCDGNCGGSDVFQEATTWRRDPATGVVTEKWYPPNAGQQTGKVRYEYSPGGHLQSRTYVSVNGSNDTDTITTSYTYDPATGDLNAIFYDDAFATPWNTFTYDRQGRPRIIGDGQGSRTLAYTPFGRLASESMTGTITKTLTRQYSNSSLVGRPLGLSTGPDYTTTYGYDATGRLDHVFGPGLPSGGAHYLYKLDSDLVEDTRFEAAGSSVMASAHRSFEDQRDLVTAVENRWQSLPPFSKYAYVNDNLSRRQSVAYTGTAFAEETHNKYTYNRRDELASARGYVGADPNATNAPPIDERQFTYCYDKIGNRLASTVRSVAPVQTVYASNDLNQYSQIAVGQGPAQNLYYDERGNLLDDGNRWYEWDAENRLVSVEPVSPVIGDKEVRFAYDYMGRRVRKQVWEFLAGGWNATAVLDRKFVYDGWNLIMELDALNSDAVVRRYTWGLDLAGQNADLGVSGLHAAGGIGGLLALDTTLWASIDPEPEGMQGEGGGGASLMVFEDNAEVRVLDQEGTPTSQPGASSIAFADSEGASGEAIIENPADPTDGTLSYVKPDGSVIDLDLDQMYDNGDGQQFVFSDGGGTQALLSVTLQPSGPYWYFYDANGNVGQVLYSGSGTIAAAYEYDPYGNSVAMSGAFAQSNSVRFSTRVWDDQSSLYYCARRYYSPERGRWISNDPSGINGGLSLTVFVSNNPITSVDPYGLYEKDVHKYLTMFLAQSAGINATDCKFSAQDLGREAQQLDEEGDPRNPITGGYWARLQYHFTTESRRKSMFDEAIKTCKARDAGEFIHAFQDSFSHQMGKTRKNESQFADRYGSDAGHAMDGHYPDWTWLRPELADQMAQETYEHIKTFATKCCRCELKSKAWSEIGHQVRAFNRVAMPVTKKAGLDELQRGYEDNPREKLCKLFPGLCQAQQAPNPNSR